MLKNACYCCLFVFLIYWIVIPDTGTCTVESNILTAAATYTSSSSFVYVNHDLTWNEANACCLSVFNGYLATITSLSQNTEILTAIGQSSGSSKWIGWYDPFETNDPNQWQWFDGTAVTYTKWNSGQPNGNEFCGRLSLNTNWFDAPCSSPSDFVCNVNQGMYLCIIKCNYLFYFVCFFNFEALTSRIF